MKPNELTEKEIKKLPTATEELSQELLSYHQGLHSKEQTSSTMTTEERTKEEGRRTVL